MAAVATLVLEPIAAESWTRPLKITLSYPHQRFEKSQVQLQSDSPEIHRSNVFLGRGNATGITDTGISRQLCSIEFLTSHDDSTVNSKKRRKTSVDTNVTDTTRTNPSLTSNHLVRPILRILKSQDDHKLEVNGNKVTADVGTFVYLKNGDTISLHEPKPYRYQVHLSYYDSFENKATSVGRKFVMDINPNTNPLSQQVARRAAQHLWDDMFCPICLEIIVEAHAANPCGHVFCGGCVKPPGNKESSNRLMQTLECPSCRECISSFTHLRTYDNMLWNLLLCGNILTQVDRSKDETKQDIINFLKRCGKDSEITLEERQCLMAELGTNSIIPSYSRISGSDEAKATPNVIKVKHENDLYRTPSLPQLTYARNHNETIGSMCQPILLD